jgi:hypothetical protein
MDHTIDMGNAPMGDIPFHESPHQQPFEQNNDFGSLGVVRSNSLSGPNPQI